MGLRLGLWYVKRRLRIATVGRRSPTLLGKAQWLAAGAGVAVALAYLLDAKRRGKVKQAAQSAAATASSAAATASSAASTVMDKAAEVAPSAVTPTKDLARKVRDALGQDGASVDVTVEGDVVFLRGEASSAEAIGQLVRSAAAVDGVRAVQSLLHLPGTPAPTVS
jgi:osmotically-inducible protein OsmY